jgi:hypothetical protein
VAYYAGVMSKARPPDGAVLHIMQGHMSTARAWATAGHYGASWHFSVGRVANDMRGVVLVGGG